MEKDTHITDVIFRVDTTKDFKGTIFALLPHDCATKTGLVQSYQHIGQHSSANYNHCLKTSRLACPSEYTELFKEMENLGYNLNVIKKQNYKKFLESYHKIRK